MPTAVTSELPKPKSWEEFEDIIWDIYARKWQDSYAQRYGRNGQNQHGVDIYGQPHSTDSYVAVQCKRYTDGSLTKQKIESEIKKAEKFPSQITEYIIATTVSRDAALQDSVRKINKVRKAEDKFSVHIVFWEDICSELAATSNRDLLNKYFGEWKNIFQSTKDDNNDYFRAISSSFIPQVKLFHGRQNELKKMTDALRSNKIVVVGGVAGIGKTSLVAQYVQLNCDLSSVLWIEGEQTQISFLTRIAYAFYYRFDDNGLLTATQDSSLEFDVLIKIAIASVNRHSCLLVLDNYHKISTSPFFEQFLIECSSDLQQGRLVVITRKWQLVDNLLNQPYVLQPLSRLDIDSSVLLMRELGLINENKDQLIEAHHRVDGHPKFITLLAVLAETYPLKKLLEELPHIPDKIYQFLQNSILGILGHDAKELLFKLAVFDVPFELTVLPFLFDDSSVYYIFDNLVANFLVTKLGSGDRGKESYTVHNLEKEGIKRHFESKDPVEIHKEIYTYYEQLTEGSYLDANRSVYHALQAELWESAERDAVRLLSRALEFGAYDIVLTDAEWIKKYPKTNHWYFIHFMSGYVARIKGQYVKSIEAYEHSVDLAKTVEEKEKSSFELASTLVIAFDEGLIEDFERSRSIYNELLLSNDPEVKIHTLTSLASLESREGNVGCIQILKKGLKIATNSRLPSKNAYVGVYFELAEAYSKFHNDTKKALYYIRQCIAVQSELEFGAQRNPEPWYYAHLKLGKLLTSENLYNEAILAYKQCVEIDVALSNDIRLANSLLDLGRIYCICGSYKKSLETLAHSLLLIEKYQISFDLQLDNFKWMAISNWYENNHENALLIYFHYMKQCELYRVKPIFMSVIRESDINEKAKLSDILQTQNPLLILPSRFTLGDLQRWKDKIVEEHPEFSRFMFMTARPYESSNNTSRDKLTGKYSIGRNDPCPCGSGKKHKHCCGKGERAA